jgi:hypothetical protein
VARWNGSSWSALESCVDDTVFVLMSHDDGSDPGLLAGGAFDTAGGLGASRVGTGAPGRP